ncbi:MAG: sigma 54-interacting transcriptional regulator [Vicinamibacteria bacterium]
MDRGIGHEPEFESLKQILLDMAHERSLPALLSLLVERLRNLREVALARIWLIRPGDLCATCPARPECPDQTRCLHLVASAARQVNPDSGTDWFRMDGSYRRFPLRIRHIGNIGATGESLLLDEAASDREWFARGDWLQKEGVKSFAGHPLIFRSEILGVLGVFRRARFDDQEFMWLRAFADHAAAAIANARAFEEIERLKKQVELENTYLLEEVRAAHAFGDIVGTSAPLRRVLEQIEMVAPTDSSVLILGESGTGKELIARAIHDRSKRSGRPMVKVNCGAIPKELFESEFFGHVRGAFTGALQDRMGRFQLADHGTLFLDEVAEIPLDLQSKLLRVLQDGTFERVGDIRTRKVDVRVIAATNRSMEEDVTTGRFREDLYYRLNVFPLTVAPLRDRIEDIPALAADCLQKACKRLGVQLPKLKQSHVQTLQSHDWPGNVRELQNVIERAIITSRSGVLRFDLPQMAGRDRQDTGISAGRRKGEQILKDEQVKRLERENILAALEQTRWKISGTGSTAELLGLSPSTLRSRLKAMGIYPDRPRRRM